MVDALRDRRTPLDKCLDVWVCWQRRNDTGIGWRGQSALLASEASASSDQLYDRMDNQTAEAVEAMINSLPQHLGWAIRKRCSIVTLWKFPRLVFVDVLVLAEHELEKKLRNNIATGIYFR